MNLGRGCRVTQVESLTNIAQISFRVNVVQNNCTREMATDVSATDVAKSSSSCSEPGGGVPFTGKFSCQSIGCVCSVFWKIFSMIFQKTCVAVTCHFKLGYFFLFATKFPRVCLLPELGDNLGLSASEFPAIAAPTADSVGCCRLSRILCFNQLYEKWITSTRLNTLCSCDKAYDFQT